MPSFQFDTKEAVAVIVLGALAFLVLVHRGFRGMIVEVS